MPSAPSNAASIEHEPNATPKNKIRQKSFEDKTHSSSLDDFLLIKKMQVDHWYRLGNIPVFPVLRSSSTRETKVIKYA